MAPRTSALGLVAANILIPIAILIFASGFFPYKPFLAGLAQYESLPHGDPPEAPFDKVIFMVVDALRSDFVYTDNSGFKFVQSLISAGEAFPFTAHATSPTITMPRIKAITTGSTPSFLDLILNFAESDTTSTLAAQDTWLAQMKAKNTGKLIMYGDDTWLKLFPDTFDRAEGTSSFFVSDFTEVDYNVTRHIPGELKNDDWNTMVLHFLGLDHIGHKAGPRSPNMIPKQYEMDGIVKLMYEAMTTYDHLESTLLVLCGDHGMNDAGNHGGSAPGETSPALVFMSPKFKSIHIGHKSPIEASEDFQLYQTVEQSDIAPTLAALLGFPVPRNNLGAFIQLFWPFWSNRDDRVQILLRNAKQIVAVVTATFPSFEADGPSENCEKLSKEIDELACQWRGLMNTLPNVTVGKSDVEIKSWMTSMTKWLSHAQDIMTGTASNYDVPKLVIGLAVSTIALGVAIIAAAPTIAHSWRGTFPILAICFLYGVMMFASSYVEEEQHFWYWATSAWLMLLCIKCTRKNTLASGILTLASLVILILGRVARRWNQTGQKFAGSPDIARTFFSSHRFTLWALIIATYLYNLQSLVSNGFPRFKPLIAASIATLLATAALTFKINFTYEDSPELMAGFIETMAKQEAGVSLVTRARIVFGLVGFASIYTVVSGKGHNRRPNPTLLTLHSLLTLLLLTQSRATNIPLLLLSSLQLHLLQALPLSLVEISTTSLLLQHASFFTFGNSNAISSIDLSSAYNGIATYNPVLVGILVFVSNWAGSLWWVSGTNLLLLEYYKSSSSTSSPPLSTPQNPDIKPTSPSPNTQLEIVHRTEQNIWQTHITLLTLFATSSLTAVMGACMVLRSHLFIWTVFSPKFLFEVAWALGMHGLVNLGVGGALWALGLWFVDER